MDDELRRRMAPLSERQGSLSGISPRRPVETRPYRPNSLNNGSNQRVDRRPAISNPPSYAAPSIEQPIVLPKKKTRKPSFSLSKRYMMYSGFIIIIALIALGAYLFLFSNKSTVDKKGPALVTNLSKPNFIPLVPQGEAQLASQKLSTSFNKAQDSYSYDDLYLGVPIEVSEQPMPSNNSSTLTSSEIMSSLVKKYNANTPVSYQSGTAYVANVSATNKQLIIFNEKDLLVLIQSSMNIAPEGWVSYIDNLYQPSENK